jgi:hypothetical protein
MRFLVSTSQKQYEILVVTKDRGQEFLPEDVELLTSLASHVAVALECALARDRARSFRALAQPARRNVYHRSLEPKTCFPSGHSLGCTPYNSSSRVKHSIRVSALLLKAK